MINTKEALSVLVVAVVLSLIVSFSKGINAILFAFLSVFLILLINIIAKKIASFYLDSEIEVEVWTLRRYGFKAHEYFKRPFLAGIFFPVIVAVLSLGNIIWMASLVFEVKPKAYRAAKRHGLYSYSEMTESHIGQIAAIGIFASLFAAFVGYLLGFSEFSRLSIYFAFFNMLPFSDLDGNKIFFGSMVLWAFLAALVLIALGYAFFLV